MTVLIGLLSAVMVAGGDPALAAADHPVTGTATPTYRLVVVPKATCNPKSPTQPSDELCRYRVSGKFVEGTGYLGAGTLGGRIFLDYGHVDHATGCIPTGGVFKLHVGTDYVRGSLAAGSVSCPGGVSGSLDQSFTIIVKSGVGAYSTVSGGLFDWSASVSSSGGGSTLTGTASFDGTVTTVP